MYILGVCGFPNSPVPDLRVGPGFFRVGSGRSSGIPEKFQRSADTVFTSEISLALRFKIICNYLHDCNLNV